MPHRQVDRIDQRGFPFRSGEEQTALYVRDIVREIPLEFSAIGKGHQKRLVFGIGSLPKRPRRQPRFVHLATHAPAGVEHQPHGKRSVFAAERHDRLLLLVVIDAEVIPTEPAYNAAHPIGHGHRHEYKVYVHLDRMPMLLA